MKLLLFKLFNCVEYFFLEEVIYQSMYFSPNLWQLSMSSIKIPIIINTQLPGEIHT